MHKERIQLEDSVLEVLGKLSEGNPGAIDVCSRIYSEGATIDPQSFHGGLSALMLLDSYGIYGSRIWMLYKDVCKENLVTTLAVLRACQLGMLSSTQLLVAIENYGRGVDAVEILAAVKVRLTQFAKNS